MSIETPASYFADRTNTTTNPTSQTKPSTKTGCWSNIDSHLIWKTVWNAVEYGLSLTFPSFPVYPAFPPSLATACRYTDPTWSNSPHNSGKTHLADQRDTSGTSLYALISTLINTLIGSILTSLQSLLVDKNWLWEKSVRLIHNIAEHMAPQPIRTSPTSSLS